jgi:hypothetical protein
MKLQLRPDGTIVYLDSPSGPYHVVSKNIDPQGKYDLEELQIYAQEHPEDVIGSSQIVALESRAERDRLMRDIVDTYNAARWEDMTEAERQRVRDYRQALKDLPQQPGFPDKINWPEWP